MKPFTKRLALVTGLLFVAMISVTPLEAVDDYPYRGVMHAECSTDCQSKEGSAI